MHYVIRLHFSNYILYDHIVSRSNLGWLHYYVSLYCSIHFTWLLILKDMQIKTRLWGCGAAPKGCIRPEPSWAAGSRLQVFLQGFIFYGLAMAAHGEALDDRHPTSPSLAQFSLLLGASDMVSFAGHLPLPFSCPYFKRKPRAAAVGFPGHLRAEDTSRVWGLSVPPAGGVGRDDEKGS